MYSALIFAIAGAVTALFVGVLLRLAPSMGLVQEPGGHRVHAVSTPVVGGVAMFCGFAFAVLMLQEPLGEFRGLFAGAALVVVIGVLDDLQELPSRLRFLAQFTAGVIMTLWGGVMLYELGALTGQGSVQLGSWAVPLTVFAVMGVINAVNLSDGLDGQAGGMAGVMVALLMFVAWRAGANADLHLLGLVLASLLVFLAFNAPTPWRKGARCFMGDAGSMLLGFVLVWFLVKFSQQPNGFAPVTSLWLLALPLIDTVAVLLRRLMERKSPFVADRTHYHHMLLMFGLSEAQTVAVVVVLTGLFGLFGLLAPSWGLAEKHLFWAFIALFLLYFAVNAYVMSAVRRRRVVFGVCLERRLGPSGPHENDRRRQRSHPPTRPPSRRPLSSRHGEATGQ